MPLMLEDCPLNDEFNFLLIGAQRYAAYRKSAEVLNALVRRLRRNAGLSGAVCRCCDCRTAFLPVTTLR